MSLLLPCRSPARRLSLSASLPLGVAAHGFLTSFDLLCHSSTLLSLTDLLTLTTVSRFLHSVADSDQVWRPRLQSATRVRHSRPVNNTGEWTVVDVSEQKTDTDDASSGSSEAPDQSKTVCTCSQQDRADLSASCKSQYLSRFQCVYNGLTHCHRLPPPRPLLLVNPGAHGSMVAMMRARRTPVVDVPVGVGEWQCMQSICLQCTASLATVTKAFYDTRSEWAGSFTMTPLSVVAVPPSMVDGLGSEASVAVDVRYWHVGAYEDVDYRRFVVKWRASTAQRQLQQLAQPTTGQRSTTDGSQTQLRTPSTQPPADGGRPLRSLTQAVRAGVRNAADSIRSAVSPRTATSRAADGSSASEIVTPAHWHVLSMAPYCSGALAFHSPSNVVVTDALRYSHLPRAQQARPPHMVVRRMGPAVVALPRH